MREQGHGMPRPYDEAKNLVDRNARTRRNLSRGAGVSNLW